MANVTLSIPEILYKKMQKHPELKWSEVARQAIQDKIQDQELLADLKAIAKAEQAHKEGKTVSFERALKELGLRANEI